MLHRLHIQNLAFLRAIEIVWGPHLNLLTGETGAGKSLLIESLGALLGFRADLPPLTEKAIIEAEFSRIPEAVLAHLEEKEETLLLRCELYPQGKRRFFLNDSPISSQVLREIGFYLIEIHSQHETQQVFQPSFQRELLDNYAELREELEVYRRMFFKWKSLSEEVSSLESRQIEIQKSLEALKAPLLELESARLSKEEYERLESQMRRLEHRTQALQILSHWYNQLDETPHSPTVILKEAEKALNRLPLPEISSITSLMEQARSFLQEAVAQIQALLDNFSEDPSEIEKMQKRYDLYNTLLLKYRRPNIDSLLEFFEECKKEYQSLSEVSAHLAPAKAELVQLTEELLKQAYKIELARIAAAQTLSDHVQAYLEELGLTNAHFHISVERMVDPQSPYKWQEQPVLLTPHGFSSISFLLRTHPKLPLAPLSQVASGGETARIMLALKAALAEKVQLPTLVLDEIDTGLSGEGARRMGSFIARLAERLQILIITHLPALACQRGKHFYIWKEATAEGYWQTAIRELSDAERVQELARMLGGEPLREATLAAARELLRNASAS
ncbi:MAG: hypothetical protein RMJ66_05435 [Bacteroidia bacterium]|nr:hypothetical protein [Bacteroidia bacterium]MDW8134491.1 hypothetical protein [Bacteroidia bacterium]